MTTSEETICGQIATEVRDGVATVVIDNPRKRNAINGAMWRQLAQVLEALAADDAVRVLLIRGAGGRAFSAGADIEEFEQLARNGAALADNTRAVQSTQALLEEFPVPTIAMIQGACVGGGCGLALACDFRIAGRDARFGITPARLGLLYSERDTRRLHRLVGPAHCREILFKGEIFDGQRALQMGMLNELLPEEALEGQCMALAQQLSRSSRYALKGMKATLARIEGYGQLTSEQLQSLFDNAFTAADCAEGTAAFLQKRRPDFT